MLLPQYNDQPDLQHLGPGQWRIWHDDGVIYNLNLKFHHTPYDIVKKRTLVDLDPRFDYRNMPMRSINFLFVFLNQFEEFDARCPNWHESGTECLINQCAQYQKDILVRESPILPDQFDQVTLVAMLLRCLVMSLDISKVDGNYSRLCVLDGPGVLEMRPEEDSDYWGLSPAITIQRIDRPSNQRKNMRASNSPESLPVILTKAVATAQHIISRRRPQDFPCLIYCLCLLNLIAGALRTEAEFMSPVGPAKDMLYDILYTLCDLYTFCSGDVHPLMEDIDISAYQVLADNDPIAVRHFEALSQLWKEAGESGVTVSRRSPA
ncbi:MAG: hypothetical protein Q9166_007627 [cf. Caloplaca sp. 2 TL-2023]